MLIGFSGLFQRLAGGAFDPRAMATWRDAIPATFLLKRPWNDTSSSLAAQL